MINQKTYNKQFKSIILTIIIARYDIKEKQILGELSNLAFFEQTQKELIEILS